MVAMRSKLFFVAFLMPLAAASAAALAEYPERPIRIVVPFTPGGGTDIIARALGQHLSGTWGQNVIIDNRPGGNTVIASEIVARARPDGYTLLIQINSLTALPALPKEGLGTISLDQFSPVSLVATLPHLLVVHRSVPAANVKELVALAKASPGKLSYATPGAGTPVHLAAALFANMAGINLLHVPYKGAAEYTASVLGNHTQIVFGSAPTAIPQVKSGAVKALAVSTAKRIPQMPELPTMAESGFAGFDIVSWYGILAPAKTSADIIAKLAKEIGTATKSRKFTDVLPDYEMIGNTPAAFGEFLRKDAQMSARVIAQAGVKAN